MSRRITAVCMTVLCCLLFCGKVSAAEQSLLLQEQTRLTSKNGTVGYSPEGALMLTAADTAGATAAIDLNRQINVYETPFVQLSLTSSAPFNIALKLHNGTQDIFPQTAAPAWYEGFQEQAPAAGEGVNAGEYTLSLSIPAYAEYNDMIIPEDGVLTLKTVYVMLRSAGGITLEHLAVSEHGEFLTSFGKTGQTARLPIPITTAEKGTIPTTVPTYDAGGVMRYRSDRVPVGGVVLLAVAALSVAGMIVVSRRKIKGIEKKRQNGQIG